MSKVQINAVVFLCLCGLWLVGSFTFPRYAGGGRLIEDFAEIPFALADWRSEDPPYDGKANDRLPTASVLGRSYRSEHGDVAFLTIVYSSGLGDLHQPEVCLLGAGWVTSVQRKVTLRPAGKSPFEVTEISLVDQNNGQEQIGVYWFNSPRSKTSLLSWYKLRLYASRLLGHSKEGSALVRILVPVQGGDRDGSSQAAVRFAEQVSPEIDAMMLVPPRFSRR